MQEARSDIADKREAFWAWASRQELVMQQSELYNAVDELEKYCIEKGLIRRPLLKVTRERTMKRIRLRLERDVLFRLTNYKKSERMLRALETYSKYLDFVRNEAKSPLTDSSEVSESAPEETAELENNSSNICTTKEAQAPAAEPDGLSPELQQLLKDEDMQLLREKLREQGILTLEQFEGINTWQFMNRHALYSISQRQDIHNRISDRLKDESSEQTEQRLTLKTRTASYCGSTPAEAFAGLCEHLAQKYPLKMRSLINAKYYNQGSVVLLKTEPSGTFVKLSNLEAYINGNLTAQAAVVYGQWLCKMCGEEDAPTKLMGDSDAPPKKEVRIFPPKVQSEPVERQPASAAAKRDRDKELIEKAEELVLSADLEGMTENELYRSLNAKISDVKNAIASSRHIVLMNNRLRHDEAFVDWEEGAQQLEAILTKLLDKNGGYVSASQLYNYVRADMQLFLNDNDMDDQQMVFDFAKHLFDKLEYHGRHLSFKGNMHISPDSLAIASVFDAAMNYARLSDGFFREDDLVAYLKGVGLKTGNLRGQMRVYDKPAFLTYDSEHFITSESMGIKKSWLNKVSGALNNLFSDMGDHIVLRRVPEWWLAQLPALPGNRPWTILLLQSVLMHYSKQLNGAHTISVMDGQSLDTVQAMLVSAQSEVQSFPDAVIAVVIDEGMEGQEFEVQKLRKLLVSSGMIAGNELLFKLPELLDKDERFLWDIDKQSVKIRA